jgi:hypothetical protein
MKYTCKYCNCKHNNFGSHVKVCKTYRDLETKLTSNDAVKNDYISGCSISYLCTKYNVGRHFITRCITNSGVTLRGFNYDDYSREFKQSQMKETLYKKYGVINYGQLNNQGYSGLNNVPYTIPKFIQQFNVYRDEVQVLTRKLVNKLNQRGEIPNYCSITGIEFADCKGKVNPNDFRKRSVDHCSSVLNCFLNGISPSEAASINNITFMLKYCNTIKGYMNLQEFKDLYGKQLTSLLLYED